MLHNLGVNLAARVATPWAIFAWIQEQRRGLSSQLLLLLPLLLEVLLIGLSQSAQAVNTAELRSFIWFESFCVLGNNGACLFECREQSACCQHATVGGICDGLGPERVASEPHLQDCLKVVCDDSCALELSDGLALQVHTQDDAQADCCYACDSQQVITRPESISQYRPSVNDSANCYQDLVA